MSIELEPVAHACGGRTEVRDDDWGAVHLVIGLDERFGVEALAGLESRFGIAVRNRSGTCSW